MQASKKQIQACNIETEKDCHPKTPKNMESFFPRKNLFLEDVNLLLSFRKCRVATMMVMH